MEKSDNQNCLDNENFCDVKHNKIQDMFDMAGDMRKDFASMPKYFARAFSTDAGKKVLAWLCNMTIGRYLPPNVKETELWYLEGQRFLVHFIMNMVDKGK